VTEPSTLLSHQEPVDNFPRVKRHEDLCFGRGIQEPGEPHEGVQQVSIQRADVNGPDLSMISRLGVTGLKHDRTDKGGGEFQAEAEEWLLLRGFEDLTDAGQIDRHQKIVEGVVPVVALSKEELLAPLGNHAQRRLDHAVNPFHRHGVAVQVQPLERLDGPIEADDSPDSLHQLLAVGLQQHDLACCRLVDHSIHSNLFPGFCLAHLEDLQD
jgi:hypothetical protein